MMAVYQEVCQTGKILTGIFWSAGVSPACGCFQCHAEIVLVNISRGHLCGRDKDIRKPRCGRDARAPNMRTRTTSRHFSHDPVGVPHVASRRQATYLDFYSGF